MQLLALLILQVAFGTIKVEFVEVIADELETKSIAIWKSK